MTEHYNAKIAAERASTEATERLDLRAALDPIIDSIEAVAHGQGAMAAAEWGLGERSESYVTNPATRNLLKGLVRLARAALTGASPSEPSRPCGCDDSRTCPRCQNCPECGGTGSVLVEAPDGTNGSDVCTTCGGSGRAPEEEREP